MPAQPMTAGEAVDGRSHRWRQFLLMTTILVIVVAIPFVYIIGSAALEAAKERRNRLPFDSAAWKASLARNYNDPLRIRMVDDLLRRYDLPHMTRDEIVSLLGMPPKIESFRDYQFVYWLGPERYPPSIDSEWLAIRFSDDGRVVEARIVQD
jgi:hypothetical protein